MSRLARLLTVGAVVWGLVLVAVTDAREAGRAPEVAPVIDDEALERAFVDGLVTDGRVIGGLSGAEAQVALQKAVGRKAGALPDSQGSLAVTDDFYAQVRGAVVVLGSVSKCEECPEWHMDGVSSGWLAGPDGLVATSYHVLDDEKAGHFGVMAADGRVFPLTEVVAADRDGDAALVRFAGPRETWPYLSLAEEVGPGDNVRVISHPDGRFYSLSSGIVSRLHRGMAEEGMDQRVWVSVTADFGGGSSGAPLLNDAGRVVGMVSSTQVLLAGGEEGREPSAEDVQMVFRDGVSVETLRGLFED